MNLHGAKLAIVIALSGLVAFPTPALAMTPAQAATSKQTPPTPTLPKDHPNQTGAKPSAYTGKFYRAVDEDYRLCVAQREGRHQYWTTGSNGLYESTYQMTDALIRGASWMIQTELKEMFGNKVGKQIAQELRETPGRHWNRFYMDMAFWTVLNWNGPRSGAKHWAGGRFSCWPGMNGYPEGRIIAASVEPAKQVRSERKPEWKCKNSAAQLLYKAGFTGWSHKMAWAITYRESKHQNLDEGSPWYTGALGMWQIQTSAHSGKSWWSRSAMLDPYTQSRIVYKHMTNKGKYWVPWGLNPDGSLNTTHYGGWSSWQHQNWIMGPFQTGLSLYPCKTTPPKK